MKLSAKLRVLTVIGVLLGGLVAVTPAHVYAETKSIEPTRDTYVDEEIPTGSYGSIGLGTIGYESPGSYSKFVLLHFDVTSIPAGAVIDSAKLTLRLGGCIGSGADLGNTTYGGYIANGSPAWTESSTYQQLSTSGSSLDGVGAKIVSCTPGAYFDFDIKDLAQYWIDRAGPNDGMYLSGTSGGNWTRVFYMREATASSRPKLTINYTIPYEVVATPDGAPSSASSPTPAAVKDVAKAQSTAQPLAPDESLAAPSKLTALQTKNSLFVELAWEKSNSEKVELYRIYRKEINGEDIDKKVGEVSSSLQKFTDKDTQTGKKYSYFLRSVRSGKESKNSDPVMIEVKALGLAAKTSVQALQNNNSQLGRSLVLATLLTLLLSVVVIVFFIKHRQLHKKHKELVKSVKTKPKSE